MQSQADGNSQWCRSETIQVGKCTSVISMFTLSLYGNNVLSLSPTNVNAATLRMDGVGGQSVIITAFGQCYDRTTINIDTTITWM